MMARSGKLYLRDILEAINKIETYTKGLSFKDFSGNKIVIDAVIRNLEIIGEAAKNLSIRIKSFHKEIPWKEMAGMKNKVIHEYFGVDLEIVWKTIKYSLPALTKPLKDILNNL